ncbi:hypothetical protein BU16DRAFT_87617 [Lophium mytilinum]|uniref:Uncharacterized protein n=1 Tax=Lophium mytilinum TaxID=390894 RepID=A0A6A6QKB6_9PEZI|nr:hypothetical protein BU16DRAFT_87617 [Lophium mytilinum]
MASPYSSTQNTLRPIQDDSQPLHKSTEQPYPPRSSQDQWSQSSHWETAGYVPAQTQYHPAPSFDNYTVNQPQSRGDAPYPGYAQITQPTYTEQLFYPPNSHYTPQLYSQQGSFESVPASSYNQAGSQYGGNLTYHSRPAWPAPGPLPESPHQLYSHNHLTSPPASTQPLPLPSPRPPPQARPENLPRPLTAISVADYFHQHACVPIPWRWEPLSTPIKTYYIEAGPAFLDSKDWLGDWVDQEFHTVCLRDRKKPKDRHSMKYHLTAESTGGHFRPEKFKWKLSNSPAGKSRGTLWTYCREKDAGAPPGQVRFEGLYDLDGNRVLTSFKHKDPSHVVPVDTLSFQLPNGEEFQWRSNHPISTLDGYRWDYQRHALFRLSRGVAEELIADNAPWDGRGKKPLDSADALTIRAQNVDHSMVIATLQTMKVRQWEDVLRVEALNDKEGVKKTVKQARKTELGIAYWTQDDFTGGTAAIGFELGSGIVSGLFGA